MIGIGRPQRHWVPVLCGALAVACGDDTKTCAPVLLASVGGSVLDRDGNRIVPDRVLIRDHRGVFECEVNSPENGAASYTCWVGHAGPAIVTAHVGDEQVSQPLWLHTDETGCHVVTEHVDLQLE